MTDFKKRLLGVLSFWPLIYLFLFLTALSIEIYLLFTHKNIAPLYTVGFLIAFVVFHLFTIVESLGLTIYYSVLVFENDKIPKNVKFLWVVGFIFGNVIFLPVYWYLFIRKEEQ